MLFGDLEYGDKFIPSRIGGIPYQIYLRLDKEKFDCNGNCVELSSGKLDWFGSWQEVEKITL